MKRNIYRILIIAGMVNLIIAIIIFGLAFFAVIALQHTDAMNMAEWYVLNPEFSLPILGTIIVFALSSSETIALGEDFLDFMDKYIWKTAA
ncbi:MAG: hypothetical protein NTX66_00940 [Candidatus Falkowbacteria bacterium]|nr:hypothetical protein [Candidatus Falkowbacteria bacterium]